MTQENKARLIEVIEKLFDGGNTNIYSGIEKALPLLREDYSSGNRTASMILLSDGYDNYNYRVLNKIQRLLESEEKKNITFTLHTFGYGSSHDSELMKNIAKIKGGGYFPIKVLTDIQDAYLTIYGSLSTVCAVNVKLLIKTKFFINKIYGMNDMYQSYLNYSETNSSMFTVTILQLIHGQSINFVSLMDIPDNTPKNTEIMEANIEFSGKSQKAKDQWDQKFSLTAYEEYIRCICLTYYEKAYDSYYSKNIILEGYNWIKENYTGNRDWEGEFNETLNDLDDYSYGRANLLSKIYELETDQLGMHYSSGNSYTRTIIDSSHNIDTSKLPVIRIIEEIIINIEPGINYYYYYLKEGKGTINKLSFSGSGSSLIIYSGDTSGQIRIKPTSDYLDLYYYNETKIRLQTLVDQNHPGKIIINKKDFPYEFYSRIDSSKDITFNLEFLKFDVEGDKDPDTSFEINAYIIDDREIDKLSTNNDSIPSANVFNGYYDNKYKMGKVVLKKSEISK
jgi:hypothetical protein